MGGVCLCRHTSAFTMTDHEAGSCIKKNTNILNIKMFPSNSFRDLFHSWPDCVLSFLLLFWYRNEMRGMRKWRKEVNLEYTQGRLSPHGQHVFLERCEYTTYQTFLWAPKERGTFWQYNKVSASYLSSKCCEDLFNICFLANKKRQGSRKEKK